MMRKILKEKKVWAFLGIMMTVILTGCSLGKGGYSAADEAASYSEPMDSHSEGEYNSGGVFGKETPMMDANGDYDVAAEEAAVEYEAGAEASESGVEGKAVAGNTQKMITNWNLTVETKNFDQAMQQIYDSIKKLGGYIESEYESKRYDNTRSNSLTIRIPEDKAEDWVTKSADFGTITSKAKTQQNATLQYIDMECRISSLKAEKEALEKILKSAKSVKDIIEVQSELQNVNYQIEDYETQFRYLKNNISYDTLQVDIYEVVVETNQDLSFFGEVKARFTSSLYGLGYFFRNVAIGVLGYSLYIACAAVVVFVLVRVLKKRNFHIPKVKKNGKKQKDDNLIG